MLESLRRLPRTVWLVGLISLVNDTASELVYPLVPPLLTSVLMAGPKALGLIEGVAEATAALLKLVSGAVVDRTRRSKPWIVVGYGLAALGRPLMALVSSWPALLVLRFADRIGKGLRTTPRDTLLAASVSAERRGLAFGVHRGLDNAGAVLGPLLAAALLAAGVPLRDVLAWTVLPGLVCVALTLTLPETQPPAAVASAPPWRSGAWSALPARLRRFLLVAAVFTLGNSSNMFLLLRARELGVPEAQVPLLWAWVAAVAMVLSAPLSGWSDRLGRRRMLLAGYAAYALIYATLGLSTPSIGALWLWLAGYGVFLAATEGVEKALVADWAPPGLRATALGWFNMLSGLMLLPASAVFGWLYEAWGAVAAFGFGTGCALLACGLLWLWVPRAPAGTQAPGGRNG